MMDSFRIAQAAGPPDPDPMLIQADWLEGWGDIIATGVLRGLAGAGIPSPVIATLDVALISVANYPGRYTGIVSRHLSHPNVNDDLG